MTSTCLPFTGKCRYFENLNSRCFDLRFIAVLICRYFENTENVAILIISHWQSSRWKAYETHFQQTYVNGFWLWIESYIREFRDSKIYDIFTFLPCSYSLLCGFSTCWHPFHHKGNKGNNKITELRTILQRESQNS